jgi:hypothetical protein
MLAFTLGIGPFVMLGGASVAATKKYRPQLWVAWMIAVLSTGLYTMVAADSRLSLSIGLQILIAAGCGVIFCAFPDLNNRGVLNFI